MIWAGAGAVSFVGPFFIHLPFLMDLVDRSVFFFSLPFLYLPFLSGVNAVSCHDANGVFSFLIVSHDDILQTYVRIQGSRNQGVPTPYLPTLCFGYPFVHTSFPATAHPVHTLPSPRIHLTPSFTFWF